MQKDGTLGQNRAKNDYLLQPFQKGKLIIINIPMPTSGGKTENWQKRISIFWGGFISVGYIELKFVRLLIANLTDENGTVVRFSGC